MADTSVALPKTTEEKIELAEGYARLKKFVARMRETNKEKAAVAFAMVEVGAGAFAAGWARSQWADEDGNFDLFGLPIELVVGFGLNAMAAMGTFGAAYDPHMHNLANGAIAGWCYAKGAELGLPDEEETVDEAA